MELQPRDNKLREPLETIVVLENAKSLRWAIPCHPIKTGARRF